MRRSCLLCRCMTGWYDSLPAYLAFSDEKHTTYGLFYIFLSRQTCHWSMGEGGALDYASQGPHRRARKEDMSLEAEKLSSSPLHER